MTEILQQMQDGLDEILITDNEKHRLYMRAVRNENGELLGYYERFNHRWDNEQISMHYKDSYWAPPVSGPEIHSFEATIKQFRICSQHRK
jgi:hypothetical protein